MTGKRKSKKEDPISWLVILSVIGMSLLGWMRDHPVISSFLIGLLLSFIPLFFLMYARGQRIKRAQLLARNSLYRDYSPQEFEEATAEIFRRMGFSTEVTPYSGDNGIDIVLKKDSSIIGVQCKRYRADKKVGPGAVREFAGSLDGSNLLEGIFVTTSTYTPAARKAAEGSQFRIRLMDGNQLAGFKNKVEGRVNTDLVQANWWGNLEKWQRNSLLIMYTLGFSALYMGIAYLVLTVR